MRPVLILLRPYQWLKNLFVFLPLFFSHQILDLDKLLAGIWTFVAYSFAASAIYCFNDIWDVEADKKHPHKCKRPIASGQISQKVGYVIFAILVVSSLVLSFFCIGGGNITLFSIVCSYLLLNIAYCVKLKQIAIIDVFIIATGFVLRILAGGAATDIYLSHWIILMTFLLALFLAFAKRRDDVVIYQQTGVVARKNVNRYNLEFMNQVIGIIAGMTMVCYIMYTVSEEVVERLHTQYLYITSVFVLAGIIRYLQLTIVDTKSGSPTKILLKDYFVQFCVIGWVLTFIFMLYF